MENEGREDVLQRLFAQKQNRSGKHQ